MPQVHISLSEEVMEILGAEKPAGMSRTAFAEHVFAIGLRQLRAEAERRPKPVLAVVDKDELLPTVDDQSP
jgi:hypothetical protein